MFRESTISREALRGREGRASIPSVVWWDDAPDAHPPRTLRPFWVAAAATAIFGALALAADSRENGLADRASASSDVGAPFEDATAQLAVVKSVADAPVAVVVPISSVSLIDGKPAVFVVEPTLHLIVATPVSLGEQVGGEQRITKGLFAGQRVVTGDLSALESRVQ